MRLPGRSTFRLLLSILSFFCLLLSAAALRKTSAVQNTSATGNNAPIEARFLQGLRYRNIGPHRGGRVTAVSGHRRQVHTFYMGATGGGVWKTTDAGQNWLNVSDGFFETGSIGAIAVAEADPGVVYVGTGSAAIRSNVIQGRGVYKSTDAGKTWQHIGLRRVGQIGSIRVDPRDARVAFVAATGQPFGPNRERGVFRTRDGGLTWQHVLFINEFTGAVSLAMNPTNPDELYAGAWRAVRRPWTISSGGPAPECGIYKSTDGGNTWKHLDNGLPKGLIGKVDIDISAANPQRVYAILEASGNESGVYRSDDAGAGWTLINKTPALMTRPFYYTYIDADPQNPEVVYVNNLSFWKSEDGGKTFRTISTPHGDNQGMWINPDHPEIFIQSNDGGANVTLNGGQTWSPIYNQPTAEIYQVAVDNQFPYRVYGAQQDSNSTLILPSLPARDEPVDNPIQLWTQGPGCETGPILPHPQNPKIVFGACKGELYRTSFETGQTANYWVWPQNRYGHNPKDIRFRFQRVAPMEISPHRPHALYFCSHVVHRSLDQGVTWEIISPDLTANEPDKQVISGEPITRDITGEEVYSTIYAFRESVLEPGVLWAGANDGPAHISRDNGKTWKNITPSALPPGGRVQNIEPSPHRKGSAYIAVYRYLLNDWQPYIYLTNDYGATWTRLTDGQNGIPADYPTRVVREDPDREGLLYAGTEFGMFLSFNQGKTWQPFQLNLPITPVTDLRVHQKDLVVSTMGRAFWILDNLTPLHQLRENMLAASAHLYAPRDAYRLRYSAIGGRPGLPEYPPAGAQIDYLLAAEPKGELKLEILDKQGVVIRSVVSRTENPGTTSAPRASTGDEEMRGPGLGQFAARSLTKNSGMNRYTWDFRYNGFGPLVVPGQYQVRLSADGWQQTQSLTVKMDPRLANDGITQTDLEEQLALNLKIRAALDEARKLGQKIDEALKQPGGSAEYVKRLQALRARLVTASGAYPQPMLIDQFQSLSRMTNGADRRVGRSALEFFDVLKKQLADLQADFARME